MDVLLEITQGSNKGRRIRIPKKCLIGRGGDCHLRPQTGSISQYHCEIITTDSAVSVRDLQSLRGTFVNDTRVEDEAFLQNGDKLRVGPLEFEIVIERSYPKSGWPNPPAL